MGQAPRWRTRAAAVAGLRRLRVAGVIVCAAMAIFTLAGFFGVPFLLRYLARGRLAAALHRQVTIGTVRFNPYTLRLSIDHLHIGERDGPQAFSDTTRIRVKASWQSLYRLAPIIQELTIERPRVHLIRTAADRFNFSDLIAGPQQPQAGQPGPPGRPFHFAFSNIRIEGGQVWFEDRVLHEQHGADRIEVGVPFIANLPADVDIFVQPMLRMTIDGSRFRIAGIAKPFASTPESVLDLRLKRLDLPRYAAYFTQKVPIKIPQGTLDTNVQVHFVQPESGPVIRLGGSVEVDGLDVRDLSGAPLVAFKRAVVALNNIEPLGGIVSLGAIRLDGFTSNLVLKGGGATNFTPLAAAFARPAEHSPPAGPAGAAVNLTLHSLELSDGALKLTDNATAVPVVVALGNLHIGVKNFATGKQAAPFAFETQARLGAGSFSIKGALDLAHSQIATEISLDKVDLPPFQAFAQPLWAGTIASGKLGAHAKIQTTFAAGRFNLRVQPATASLDAVELRGPDQDEKPVQMAHLGVAIDQFDLAARQVALKEVRIDGLHAFVRRLRDGQFGIKSFVRTLAARSPAQPGEPPPPAIEHRSIVIAPSGAAHPAAAPAPPWRYRIEAVAVENTDATLEDDVPSEPVTLHLAPLNLHLKDVSSDPSKPIGIEMEGQTPQGAFKIDGTAVPIPLKTSLHLAAQRLDIAPVDNYLGSQLNVRLTRAALSLNGDLELAAGEGRFHGSYRGDATLGNLRLLDKLSKEKFLKWSSLNASGIDAVFGASPPAVRVEAVALSDFYTRLILNSNGNLNLRDVVGNPKSAPVSVTHAKPGTQPERSPANSAALPQSAAGGHPDGAEMKIGRIVLQGGHINFTDNFIKPHYTADLTDIAGKIGGFGTRSTQPAEVQLQGQVNASAPIDITGSLNPLAPQAFVDLKAKADGIDLPNLTPYSTKYTGYPITKGTATVDIHYHLEHDQLTADNHLFIDQLTFGDRVQSPNAVNLPIAMAVSLLKNSRGEIDVTVPVSGSLSDPQFSMGAVIFKAFSNLILKVVASPFTLLASAAGGTNHRLDHVEFAPGLAALTPESKKRLDMLAKGLLDRPGMRLSIAGRVDPKVDRPGLRDAKVERKVKAQKVRELRDKGEIVDVESVVVAPDEYGKYLEMAYKKANFDKPRNFLGLTKSLPPDEMKKLMLTNAEVTASDLTELAGARALAVRRYLGKQVDPVRMAVVAPKLDGEGGNNDTGKITGADLSIQ